MPEFDVEFAQGRPLCLLIDAPGLTVASDRTSFRRTLEPSEVVANGRTTVRFTLDLDAPERGAPHRVALGRVVDDATGEPIAGAEVVGVSDVLAAAGASGEMGDVDMTGGPRRVTTFADGRFRIALVEPPSTVWAHHPRYASARATHDGAGEVELRLTRRGSLRGVLVDREGAPLANAPLLLLQAESTPRVSTFETDDRHVRATTDAEGRFAFEHLRPSRYHLCAMRGPKDPDEKALARETVQLEAGEDRELVFRLEPPERVIVYGTVTGSELAHSRASDATPHLVPTFLPYAAEGAWTQAEPTATGYRAGGLERGRYLVLLAPANDDIDGPYALIPDVEITAFGEQRLDLRFPTGSVSGRVVLDEPREGLVGTAVPVVPEGFAREVLAAGKLARTLGVAVGEDEAFEVRGWRRGCVGWSCVMSTQGRCLPLARSSCLAARQWTTGVSSRALQEPRPGPAAASPDSACRCDPGREQTPDYMMTPMPAPSITPGDIVSEAKRSEMMRAVGQRDTKPERIVRRLLLGCGAHYRRNHPGLPGRPDFANRSRDWAVFVHGCFWHGHRDCKKTKGGRTGRVPATNSSFWSAKIDANRERDVRKARQLMDLGLRVLTIWECELHDRDAVERKLRRFLDPPR